MRGKDNERLDLMSNVERLNRKNKEVEVNLSRKVKVKNQIISPNKVRN